MVYIPFPRVDLDAHADLVTWRAKLRKADGDWKALRAYLANSARVRSNTEHPIPKCWYSELPQGDSYASDVEHFRPKNSASPLSNDKVKEVEAVTGMPFTQNTSLGRYSWLEFDYRNYRFVTALTNRAGAKHIFFPLIDGTTRLIAGQTPWAQSEYPYFLDPVDMHDANLLMVLPNGDIAPITPVTPLTAADIAGLPGTWHNDGFNYIRAVVTINLYRLNYDSFKLARKGVHDDTTNKLNILTKLIAENATSVILPDCIEDIVIQILPSAPFSLAARCALKAYAPPVGTPPNVVTIMTNIIRQIETQLQSYVSALAIDWNRP